MSAHTKAGLGPRARGRRRSSRAAAERTRWWEPFLPLVCSVAAGLNILGATSAVVAADERDRPPVVHYRIDAAYDAEEGMVTGREVIRWRNTTPGAADELCFHLYLNAFANSESTFMRGTEDAWVSWAETHPRGWGYTHVSSFRVRGTERVESMRFVQPDDGNAEDRTVAVVPLESPVPAGASIDVEVEFVSKLPRVFARAGIAPPFAMAAQWYPKLGVFANAGWNCHQYHRTTEFFADFGTYDVRLTVPQQGVVGSTGVLRDEKRNEDGTKTLRYVAERVHDFAWVVDPRFVVVEETVAGVPVRLLLQPNHVAQANRHLRALRSAMRAYDERFGPYPYPTLTVVDPGPGAGRAGGMEYPMLITVGTTSWMPGGLRFPEAVTVHEFGHQYWYAIVANDEAEDAWLDEGVNSFLEGRIMDDAYGPASYVDAFGIRAGSVPVLRARYLRNPDGDPIVRPAWKFLDADSYASTVYAKTALALETLDRQQGEGAVEEALAAYHDAWRFGHPRAADLLEVLRQVAGPDLEPYLQKAFFGTDVLDYAVAKVAAEEILPLAGHPMEADGAPQKLRPLGEADEASYRNVVVVKRVGTIALPVDVEVSFEDGSILRERWDGRDSWVRLEYTGDQRVMWAVVDPDRNLVLDANHLNNSRMRDPGTRGIVRLASRWGFWFQNLMLFLTGM